MANSLSFLVSFVILSLICHEKVTCYLNNGELGIAIDKSQATRTIDNINAIEHLIDAPDCDWVTPEGNPMFIEPIGICYVLQTTGESYRTDYDEDTNRILFKRFPNTNCEGDDFVVWNESNAGTINLNTGFLCEAHAFDNPVRGNVLFTGAMSEPAPGDFLGSGIVDSCTWFFGNTYIQVSECNQDDQTLKIVWYSDDKCENERIVGQYDLSGSPFSPDPALDECSNVLPIAFDISAPMDWWLGVFYDGNDKPILHSYAKIGEIICIERQSYYINDNSYNPDKISCKQSGLLNGDDTCRCRENCYGDNCDPGQFDGKFCGENAVCCCGDQCISPPLKRKNGQNRKSAASVVNVESIGNIDEEVSPYSRYSFYTLVGIAAINVVMILYLCVTTSKNKTHQQK
jgi:hypothetical protein